MRVSESPSRLLCSECLLEGIPYRTPVFFHRLNSTESTVRIGRCCDREEPFFILLTCCCWDLKKGNRKIVIHKTKYKKLHLCDSSSLSILYVL
jgi:hypothetical protein